MKKTKYTFSLGLFFFIVIQTHAQKFIETYYNSNWKEVITKDEASYYSYNKSTDSGWYRLDFFLGYPKNKIQMTGLYEDKENKIKNGIFRFYYYNGNLKTYGQFGHNREEGIWLDWYSNGELKDSMYYQNGRLIGISKSWYKNKFIKDSIVLDQFGNGLQASWFDDGQPSASGRIINYKKQGKWIYYHKNGKISAVEMYHRDSITQYQIFNEDGEPVQDSAIKFSDASFPDGEKAWKKYLGNNLHFPSYQNFVNTDHKVVVAEISINEDGKVEDVELVIPANESFNKEVTRFFYAMPAWIPAYNHHRRVKYQFPFSIAFGQRFE